MILGVNVSFGQQTEKKSFLLPKDANYLPQRLIISIQPAYKHLCGANDINIPSLRKPFSLLAVEEIRKAFPFLNNVLTIRAQSQQNGGNDLSLVYEIRYSSNTDIVEAVNMLINDPAIRYAEPWYVYASVYQPNDPISDTTGKVDRMWHLNKIQARQAWDISRGDTAVIIGITDTGTSFDHEDLKGNLYINRSERIDGIDNDNDGLVDNFRGWDLAGVGGFQEDNDPSFGRYDHGVAVTGIVGATPDNKVGLPGLSFNCSFLPLKVGPDTLNGITHGYQGIVYAAIQGADVINCSWGGSFYTAFGEDVVNFATGNFGCAIVASSGNTASDSRFYPAAFPRVLSVASTNTRDAAVGTSTYNYTVDVSAPGTSLYTTARKNEYISFFSGTSAAAPVAASAIALVKSHFPQYTGFQAAERVRITTDLHYQANAPRYADKLGSGRINMFRALTDPLKPSIRMGQVRITTQSGFPYFRSGDTLTVRTGFTNLLEATENVTVQVTAPGSENFAVLRNEKFQTGFLGMQSQTSQAFTFQLILKGEIQPDQNIALRFSYRDSLSEYVDFEYHEFTVNKSYLNIEVNKLNTTINSQGNFGFHNLTTIPEGVGVRYQGLNNALYEGGMLIAINDSMVSDNIRSNSGLSEQDFMLEELVQERTQALKADFEAETAFRDNLADLPIGIFVRQTAYAYTEDPHADYVIFQYELTNTSAQDRDSVYASLFTDWDIANPDSNASDYDLTQQLVYAYDVAGSDTNYYGIALLSEDDFRAFSLDRTRFSFSERNKFLAMRSAPTDSTLKIGQDGKGADIMYFTATGPITLNALSRDTLGFAVLAAPNQESLLDVANQARIKYNCEIMGRGPSQDFSVSPGTLSVAQPVEFTDKNSGNLSYVWNFGDGGTASVASPQHTFNKAGEYTVSLLVSNGTCSANFSRKILVTSIVSNNQEIVKGLSFYPNPTQAFIYLKNEASLAGPYTFSLLDLTGKVLRKSYKTLSGKGNEPLFDVSGLPTGIYLLKVETDKGVLVEKWIRE